MNNQYLISQKHPPPYVTQNNPSLECQTVYQDRPETCADRTRARDQLSVVQESWDREHRHGFNEHEE